MICGLDKNIYELISSKIYAYVKDYVIAALAVNTTESYVEIQKYWNNSSDNFGMDKINQILNCFEASEIKEVYETTCFEIPHLFMEFYEDLLSCLIKLYGKDLVNSFRLSSEEMDLFNCSIINLLMEKAKIIYRDLNDLELIKDKLNILMPKLSHSIASHENYNADELNNLIIKFLDAWGNFINKYHVITNTYLDEIYPAQVEEVYTEVMNFLISNIYQLLDKLLENGADLSRSYTTLAEYLNYLMDE